MSSLADTPTVSVCIPTYNRAQFIEEAIQSVLEQSCQDFEIIVYDDASSDDTAAVVSRVGDARIRYFRQPQQVGISRNRNSCLAVARGEYIGWLDSDDVYLPHMLAEHSAVLDAHPSVGLVHAEVEWMDEQGRPVEPPSVWFPPEGDVIEKGLDAFRELCAHNYIRVPSVLVRRECYEQVGGYNPTLQTSEDSEMWLRIALRYDLAHRAGTVARKRVHPDNITASHDLVGIMADRVRSMKAIFEGAPRDHAGVEALRRTGVAGRLFHVLWKLRAIRDQGASPATLLLVLAQTLRLNPQLGLSPRFWRLALNIVHADELSFDRAWRRLAEPPLVEIQGTRQGQVVMQKHFPSLWQTAESLLRGASERRSRAPVGHGDRVAEAKAMLDRVSPVARSALLLDDEGLLLRKRPSSHQWYGKHVDLSYPPIGSDQIGAYLERLQEQAVQLIAVRKRSLASTRECPLQLDIEVSVPKALESAEWAIYDLRAYEGRRASVERARRAIMAAIRSPSHLLVVSKGDEELLALNGHQAQHFPQTEDGRYAGGYPPDSEVAIAHLEELRAKGADYLVFPQTAFWWLDHYSAFKQYLDGSYRPIPVDGDACVIYNLRSAAK